jgi:hypothetical protein
MLSADERKAAAEINARLSAVLARIREYTGITDRERKRMIAEATISARDGLRDIRRNSEASTGAAREAAFRAAFGIDPNRAAEERALRAGLSQDAPGAVEVAARLQRALAIGDHLAAKVLGNYAWDRRNSPVDGAYYRGILNTYSQISPSVHKMMSELVAVDEGIGDSGGARMARLQDKLVTEISMPEEVSTGNTLEGWAAEDGPPAPSVGMPFGLAGSNGNSAAS